MGLFFSRPRPVQQQPMVIQQGTVPGQTTVIYGAPTYGPGYGGYGYGSDLALVGDLIVADVAADVITDVIFGGEKKKKKKNKNKKNNQKL